MTKQPLIYTLYVDGACKGNPGVGGWGALIIDQAEHKTELYAGEAQTTNNRMELTAAIEGILACPAEATLCIYTDSNYVKRGITEWIDNWKAKNWKDVKNPDLWQKLDQCCAGRQIAWHWVKGHAGHEGNEHADRLANLGVESVAKKKLNQADDDWLLNDPFGLAQSETQDLAVDDCEADDDPLQNQPIQQTEAAQAHSPQPHAETPMSAVDHSAEAFLAAAQRHAELQIKITPAQLELQGPRVLILDTETTGFYYQDSDRIIELGALEMINRRLTGRSIHVYINPEKEVGESENIHGISDAFLADKPKFTEIAALLYDYLQGAEIIAHNASFDMNFLDAEFSRVGLGKLSAVCAVTDSLAIAKSKHPGQKNSLDALVKRYEIPARDRTFHGALLDAEILADVYLAMTGGQVSLDIDQCAERSFDDTAQPQQPTQWSTPVIRPSSEELAAHQQWLQKYRDKNNAPALFEIN